MLGQRLLVETIIDELNNLCLIEQTHHRSPLHSAVNLLAGLIAYGLMPNKPRRPLQDFHRLSQSPQTDHEPTLGEFPEPPQPGAQLEGNPWQREIHLAERHPFRGLFGGDESPMRVAEVLRSLVSQPPLGDDERADCAVPRATRERGLLHAHWERVLSCAAGASSQVAPTGRRGASDRGRYRERLGRRTLPGSWPRSRSPSSFCVCADAFLCKFPRP